MYIEQVTLANFRCYGPHTAAQHRYALATGRQRHPHRAGTPELRGCRNDHDLHPPAADGWQRGTQPLGLVAGIEFQCEKGHVFKESAGLVANKKTCPCCVDWKWTHGPRAGLRVSLR
jgi:hypothetical protein